MSGQVRIVKVKAPQSEVQDEEQTRLSFHVGLKLDLNPEDSQTGLNDK